LREQATIARSQVENFLELLRNKIQQHSLAFGTEGNAVSARQLFQRMLGGCVFTEVRRSRHVCANAIAGVELQLDGIGIAI
jgi:hypothetical protein